MVLNFLNEKKKVTQSKRYLLGTFAPLNDFKEAITERKPKINKYRYIMTDRRYHQSLEECTAKSSKGHS